MPSWGNDMGVGMMVATNVHHASDKASQPRRPTRSMAAYLRPLGLKFDPEGRNSTPRAEMRILFCGA